MRQLESDFDKAVKRLRNKKDEDDKEEVWEYSLKNISTT
jgi:hypothetical protein